jgi:hypothetical protein
MLVLKKGIVHKTDTFNQFLNSELYHAKIKVGRHNIALNKYIGDFPIGYLALVTNNSDITYALYRSEFIIDVVRFYVISKENDWDVIGEKIFDLVKVLLLERSDLNPENKQLFCKSYTSLNESQKNEVIVLRMMFE